MFGPNLTTPVTSHHVGHLVYLLVGHNANVQLHVSQVQKNLFLSAAMLATMPATMSDTMSATMCNNMSDKNKKKRFFVGRHFGHYVGHLVHLHVGRRVSHHVGHHNVVSMLCEGSEMLTEWKSELTDGQTGVGASDVCTSKNYILL